MHGITLLVTNETGLILLPKTCLQIPYEQTRAINQWRSVGMSPSSDECLIALTNEERYDADDKLKTEEKARGVYLSCTYEEGITTASAQTRYDEMTPCAGDTRQFRPQPPFL